MSGSGKYTKYKWGKNEKGKVKRYFSNNKYAIDETGTVIFPHIVFEEEQKWKEIYNENYLPPKGRENEKHKPEGPHAVDKPKKGIREIIFHFEKIDNENTKEICIDNNNLGLEKDLYDKLKDFYSQLKTAFSAEIKKYDSKATVYGNDSSYLSLLINFKQKKYFVTLFDNDLDYTSGNIHTNYGYIQFWKYIDDNILLTRNTFKIPFDKESKENFRKLIFHLDRKDQNEKWEYESAKSETGWKGNKKILKVSSELNLDDVWEEFCAFVKYTEEWGNGI